MERALCRVALMPYVILAAVAVTGLGVVAWLLQDAARFIVFEWATVQWEDEWEGMK